MRNEPFADYADEGGTEPNGEFTHVERAVLSDGSVTFNVLYRTDAIKLRFACKNEEDAWSLADELDACSYIEEIV